MENNLTFCPLITFPLNIFEILRHYVAIHRKSKEKHAEIPSESRSQTHGASGRGTPTTTPIAPGRRIASGYSALSIALAARRARTGSGLQISNGFFPLWPLREKCSPPPALMAKLLYGGGLRLRECTVCGFRLGISVRDVSLLGVARAARIGRPCCPKICRKHCTGRWRHCTVENERKDLGRHTSPRS